MTNEEILNEGIKLSYDKDNSTTGYELVTEYLNNWCTKNYYTDFVVTIALKHDDEYNYIIITEFVSFTSDGLFEWNNDWWEGEPDIVLLGFSPLEELELYNIKSRLIKEESEG